MNEHFPRHMRGFSNGEGGHCIQIINCMRQVIHMKNMNYDKNLNNKKLIKIQANVTLYLTCALHPQLFYL